MEFVRDYRFRMKQAHHEADLGIRDGLRLEIRGFRY
jgi:hypothetical protein